MLHLRAHTFAPFTVITYPNIASESQFESGRSDIRRKRLLDTGKLV